VIVSKQRSSRSASREIYFSRIPFPDITNSACSPGTCRSSASTGINMMSVRLTVTTFQDESTSDSPCRIWAASTCTDVSSSYLAAAVRNRCETSTRYEVAGI